MKHPDQRQIFGPSGAGRAGGIGYLDRDRWRISYKTSDERLPTTVTREDANVILELFEKVYEAGYQEALREVRSVLGFKGGE